VTGDGYETVKVASRFGVLHLPRQVLYQQSTDMHVMPGNEVLPAHEGRIITRGLQEWACLLPGDLSFESVTRLLGWQTQELQVLSSTTVRSLVRSHGQLIRQEEQAEVETLLAESDLTALRPQLVPHQEPRRRAAWPEELNRAAEVALAAEDPVPPEGVSKTDGERVLAARQEEQALSTEELRRLGPELEADQVLAAVDEVLTRKPEKRRFWQLRTARVATTAGYRYVSGWGDSFLQHLLVLLLLCLGPHRSLLLLADGARWIRAFYAELLARIPNKQMILDWYHLHKKCYNLCGMICRGRKAKASFLTQLLHLLWRGRTDEAIVSLEAYRPEAKNETALDDLITYLRERRDFMPNYAQRRQERRYIGSAHAEKGNDLIVASRQKKQGMHWSLETSDALAALKTLMLNGGWELYWRQRKVLPLVAA
jgi:hypothetical protein